MTKQRGLKLTYIYAVLLIFAVITSVVIGISMRESSENLRKLQENTETYIEVQDSIDSMKEASDYLTEHCRAYVVSGDTDHIELYYNEVNVDRRRDRAIEVITEYNESDYIRQSLEKSLEMSNGLMNIEEYAMKLATIGYGIKNQSIDEYLADVEISKEDMALSKSDKIKKATAMVFDDEYESYKVSIREGVFNSLDNLINQTKLDQMRSYQNATRILRREYVLFFLMVLVTILSFIATFMGVIVPLNKSISYIQRNEKLPLVGSPEYSFLASAFNRMLEKNMKHSEKLSYEATHDELTGLYNRKMFEEKRVELHDKNIALIIFDIDFFKGINDTYGHETGDKILKKAANALRTSFRNEDYVCRIGGDEFVVMMVQMSPDYGFVIRRKVELVREKFAKDDGLPMTTMSIGAAFSSDSEDPDNIFRNADNALYQVKNEGRNGFKFYHDPETGNGAGTVTGTSAGAAAGAGTVTGTSAGAAAGAGTVTGTSAGAAAGAGAGTGAGAGAVIGAAEK